MGYVHYDPGGTASSTKIVIAGGFGVGKTTFVGAVSEMAAVRVTVDPAAPVPGALEVFSFLFPVFVIGLLALVVPITAVMLATDRVATGSRSASHPRGSSGGQLLGEPSIREQAAAADAPE